MEIERIGEARYALGESPLWDSLDGVLYWVDSPAPAIYCYDPRDGGIESWDLPGDYVGSMALREGGGAVLAMDAGFYLFDFATGKCEAVIEPEADQSGVCFNDGKVDRQGRFVAGSMHVALAEPAGALYRLDPDLSCNQLDNGFICSNGPCWSPDGATLYVSDTSASVIYAYDYDVETGAASNRREFYSTHGTCAQPDGATVDAEGCIWSTQFNGGRILRIAPDGTVEHTIELPVKWVASVMFGGEDLDVLFVTSIGGEELGKRDPSPEAGRLFAIRGLGVKGLPEHRFTG